jgi:hypothetical protein
MSNVYVVTLNYPYEGARVIGVYSTRGLAKVAGDKVMRLDDSSGYNEIEIDEVELNE